MSSQCFIYHNAEMANFSTLEAVFCLSVLLMTSLEQKRLIFFSPLETQHEKRKTDLVEPDLNREHLSKIQVTHFDPKLAKG